ncbi:DUF551 domain-containing protein [Escherichia coli]
MTTITNKKQYPSEQYLNELITNIEFAARAPVEVVRAMAAELQKRREADSAEPVAYIFKHPAGKLFWALTDESNKEQADVIPVYAAAPASVVPDNASEPLAYAYKELTPEIMRNHLAVFERYGIAPNDSSTTIQALRIALDGIERSDAMLHGAEPVSQTYKLNQLSGNSPVTPDGWISCSERMPDDGQEVVVQTHSGWRYIAFYESHSGLFYDSPEGDVEYVLVTHWMPLPEPPQQDGE